MSNKITQKEKKSLLKKSVITSAYFRKEGFGDLSDIIDFAVEKSQPTHS